MTIWTVMVDLKDIINKTPGEFMQLLLSYQPRNSVTLKEYKVIGLGHKPNTLLIQSTGETYVELDRNTP